MVYTNRNRFLCPAPIGALLISQRLERDGHDVRFLDLMHEKDPNGSLRSVLRAHDPELTCFSIRNVDNMTMGSLDHPLDEVAEYAALVREESNGALLIGGTAVTTFPSQIRAFLGADYAITGDDPEPVSRFVASLESTEPDLDTPGLVHQRNGSVVHNPHTLKGYTEARFSGFGNIDLKKYRRKGYHDCGLVTSSGCPMGCSFCDAFRTFGSEYRLRDPDVVVDELTELRRKHGARSIWLINSGINRPLEHGKELCARIAEANLGLSFACIIEPGELDAEMAVLMKKAGCSAPMIFGTTLNDAVLERNQPFYRREDVVEAAKIFRDAKRDFLLGQHYGAPGETLDGVRDSLELAYRLKPAMIIASYGLRIQPETPVREIAIREGVISEAEDGYQARFYLSPGTPEEELKKCIKSFRRRHPWQIVRFLSFAGRSAIRSLFN
ncbi:MAG: hypothetical protein A2V70_19290 [Planctomycetes bacterium RBG_13_63_9]|nr:MAG: hypothetical protein A2V70_19290 [Planctomycetes bacterium RBG_13_63_9]